MFKKKEKQKESNVAKIEQPEQPVSEAFDGYTEGAAEPYTASFESYKPSCDEGFEAEEQAEGKGDRKKKRKKGEAEEKKSKFNTNDFGEVGHNLVQSVLDLYGVVKYFREKEFLAKRLLETGLDAGIKISRVARSPELLQEAKSAVADLTFVLDAMLLDKIYTRHRAEGVLDALTKANSLLARQTFNTVKPVQAVSEPVQAVQPVVQTVEAVKPIEVQTTEGERVFLTPIYASNVDKNQEPIKEAEPQVEPEIMSEDEPQEVTNKDEGKKTKKSKKSNKSKSKPEPEEQKVENNVDFENIDSEGGFYEDYVE